MTSRFLECCDSYAGAQYTYSTYILALKHRYTIVKTSLHHENLLLGVETTTSPRNFSLSRFTSERSSLMWPLLHRDRYRVARHRSTSYWSMVSTVRSVSVRHIYFWFRTSYTCLPVPTQSVNGNRIVRIFVCTEHLAEVKLYKERPKLPTI